MGVWNKLQGLVFGAAVGRASSDSITPVLEPVRQHAWSRNKLRTLDVGTAAELIAKALIEQGEGEEEAGRSGYNANRLNALTLLAQSYPGLGELDRLSNRKLIGDAKLRRALRRHGYPDDFIDPLISLFSDLVSVADVAAGVQQGHLANHGGTPDSGPILPGISAAVHPAQGAVTPVAPDQQPPSKVPLTQLDIDPVDEAAGQGIDLERLKLVANLAGLPPGSAEVLQMWNRNLIDEESVDAALREGHLKTKWSAAWKRMRWNVLGAAEYAGLHLRGWITQDAMYKGGALTGHTTDQMDLLYLNRGRPMAPVQAFTAFFRGAPHPHGEGVPDRPGTFDFEDFSRAIKQSDVRSEYIPSLWAIRHAYPPLFQLGRLAQAGALPRDRVQTILRYERYEETDIQALLDFWYGGQGVQPDPHLAKAQTQLWTATHRAYMAGEATEQEARAMLTHAGVRDTAIEPVLSVWGNELQLVRKQLTATQLRKAWKNVLTNPGTGKPWTRDEVVARLEAMGYSAADAVTFIEEV